MAEYYAVLSRAIAGLTSASPDTRRAVYDKARNALISQLKAIAPALPTAEISRQRLELEEAIRRVEREIQSGVLPPPRPVPRVAPPVRPAARPIAAVPPDPDATSAADAAGTPQAMFRKAIQDAEGHGVPPATERPVAARRAPSGRTVPVPPIAAAGPPPRNDAPLDNADTEPDIGELEGLVPDMAPSPPASRPRRGYSEPMRAPEPRLAPDYGPESESEASPVIRLPAERGREMRLGPAPIDPQIDDVSPSRRGQAFREEPDFDDGEPPSSLPPVRRRVLAPLLLLVLILVLAGGLGAVAWTQRATIGSVIASFEKGPPRPQPVATLAVTDDSAPTKNGDRLPQPGVRIVDPPGAGSVPAPATTAPVAGTTTTIGLAPPPSTVAPSGLRPPAGAATGAVPAQPSSLAPPSVLTQPPTQSGAPGATLTQKATLYEEPLDPAVAATKTLAVPGTVTWAYSATGPDGPEVIGTISVPDRKMTVKLTIRRNMDPSLPASHLVEMLVTTAADFPGNGIQSMPTLVLKPAEGDRGDVLVGASATVASGYYWIALSNAQKDLATNIGLMRDRGWIDIRLVYTTGQRAILTLEKGASGQTAFAKAISAWQTG